MSPPVQFLVSFDNYGQISPASGAMSLALMAFGERLSTE